MTRAILISAALLLAHASARAQTNEPRARAYSAKAAEILARLDELLCPAGAGLDTRDDGARRHKLSASLSKKLAPLREGDLKTDLAAALNFYQQSLDAADDARPARCDAERPGAYASLCERAGGSRRALLLAKSRLRASWARAALMRESGVGVEAWAGVLSESDAERASEREMAAEAVARLQGLGARVVVYDSLAEFEDGRELARVSYERFRAELDEASARLRRIVAWLPPGATREEIRKATQAYLDGAWWWSQTRRTNVVRVSANSFAEETPVRPVADATARYTVALQWRQARDYTRRAASLLAAGR